MPYINSYKRGLLDETIAKLKNKLFDDQSKEVDYGALEYVIFKLMYELTEVNKRFANMNSLMGVLSTTGGEYTRKILGPYEDAKFLEDWIAPTQPKSEE